MADPTNFGGSTANNLASSFSIVVWTDVVCVRQLSETLQMLVTGSSVIDGMNTPCKFVHHFSSLKTMDLDFVGLKLILAQENSFTGPWRIHQHPGTDVLETIKSFI